MRNSDSRSGSGAGSGVASSKSLPIPQSRFGIGRSQDFSLPISHSRSRLFGSRVGSRFGSRFGSDFFKNREVKESHSRFWKSHSRNGSRHGSRIIGIGSEKSGVRNLEISLSRIGIEESGVTWKKPLPNPLPIPIGRQNFAHWSTKYSEISITKMYKRIHIWSVLC